MKKKTMHIVLATVLFAVLIVVTYITHGIFSTRKYHVKASREYDTSMARESSGLAKSSYKDVYYTHDDSNVVDEKTYLYRFIFGRRSGEYIGEWLDKVELEGVKNKDWEDMAITEDRRVILADIGSNRLGRSYFNIYIFPEPDLDIIRVEEEEIKEIYFRYSKHWFQHNAEAIFVKDNILYILTKEFLGKTEMYKLDLEGKDDEEIYDLELVDTKIFDSMVTGATLSPDKKSLAVLTYKSIHLYNIEGDIGFEQEVARISLEWNLLYRQYEGISFNGPRKLIISTEQGRRINDVNKNVGMRIIEYNLDYYLPNE